MNERSPEEQRELEEEKLRARQIRWPAFMPFFWMGLAAVMGSFAADLFEFLWYWWTGLLIGSLLLALLKHKDHNMVQTIRVFPVSLALAVFSLTAMLYQVSLPRAEPDNLLYYHNRGVVTINGIVVEPPELKQNSLQIVVESQSLRAEDLAVREPEVVGRVIFYLPLGSDLQYGDLVEITDELIPPDEGVNFSWREYLKHQGVYSTMEFPRLRLIARNQGNPLMTVLYRLRDNGGQVLSKIFPSPEDSLLKGILLGDESYISPALSTAYRLTGTSHIIAISGFNMSVLAGLVSLFFTRQFGRKRGAMVTIFLLGGYSLLVGASASVVRAAFMGSYAVLGSSISRKGNTLNNLGVSTLSMVLLNPHLPWDLGFQFSVMATLGLSLFAGPLQARLEGWLSDRMEENVALALSSLVSETFLLTMVAQALVLPLSIWHFNEVSWLFVIANPLILPVQPAVMVLGLFSMGAGLLWLPLGQALAWLTWPWVAYSNRMVSWLASLAPVTWSLPRFSLFWVVLYYLVLFLVVFRPKIREWTKTILRPAYILPALGGLALVVWLAVFSAPDSDLHLYIPNKPDQTFMMIKAGHGQTLLVSGSAGTDSLVDEISKQLPLFSNQLDVVIIPNCGRASLSGLFVLASKLEIGQVLWGCEPNSSQTSRNLQSMFEQNSIEQIAISTGMLLGNGPLELLFQPGEKGLNGFQLDYGHFSAGVLLPGIALEDWTGAPLCESLASPQQQSSLYLTCNIGRVLSNSDINTPESVQSLTSWSELISDGSELMFMDP